MNPMLRRTALVSLAALSMAACGSDGRDAADTTAVATTEETLALIERHQLQDSGCGAIDMLLLGSVLLTPSASLWTLDKNLGALAMRFRIDWGAAHRVN